MADVYLHSRFVEDLITEFPSDINQNIAFLGSQGPDPLYYIREKRFKKVADDIHRYRTRDFFKTMVNYVKQHNTEATYSFMFGFISHYILDAYIHPFVYYNTGVYEEDNPSTFHMRGLHMKFERSIDCVQIQKECKINPRKMNLTKYYFPLKKAPSEVNQLMHHVLQKEYQLEDGFKMYERSASAMYKTLKYIVTDRTGIKKLIYKFVDLFNKDNDMFLSDLSLYNHIENYDYHNDSKNIWLDPLTGEEQRTSIDEIIQNAKEKALDVLKKVDAYIHKKSTINLDNIFTDLSFNTGKDCKLGMNFGFIKIYNK